jgi:hypothetical protein
MSDGNIYPAVFRNRKADAGDVRLVRIKRRAFLGAVRLIGRRFKIESDNFGAAEAGRAAFAALLAYAT